ncbi:MAG: hypothetical protein MJ082_03405 [Clostridia bacterium]|nr:hypothetical protein [Clostridia bacterium]
MNEKNPVLRQSFLLLAGELVANALTALVYFLIGRFALPVVFGGLLGTVVTVGNFFALAVITDRAFKEAAQDRGTKEMTEEEIEAFTASHKASLQTKIQISGIVRTFTMLGVLVLACLVQEVFNPIALIVPLLLFRPILMLEELFIKRKK